MCYDNKDKYNLKGKTGEGVATILLHRIMDICYFHNYLTF